MTPDRTGSTTTMTAPQSPPIPTNPRQGPVAEAVARSQASEPRQATFDEVYTQEVKVSTTPGPRFEVLAVGSVLTLWDRAEDVDLLILLSPLPGQAAGMKSIAALLNNAYAMPRKPPEVICGVCGHPRLPDNPDCLTHAGRPARGLVPHAEGVAR